MQRARRPPSPIHARARRLVVVAGAAVGWLVCGADVQAQERKNYFDDPFVQVTAALAGCPVPAGPAITLEEMRSQAHGRVDRGTTCFRSGRCRLPNSYLYDKELVPRVERHVGQDESFAASSVWVMGQRRWIYLMGCVASQEQSDAIERAVRNIDDVEAVINELMVGVDGVPRYPTVRPAQ